VVTASTLNSTVSSESISAEFKRYIPYCQRHLITYWGKGSLDVPCLIGEELGLGVGVDRRGAGGRTLRRPRNDRRGPARRRFRVGGSGLWGVHDWEAERPGWQPIPPVQNQNNIPMIRISFETRTDSEDPIAPNAWRREAAARLREIAKRIAAGEAMPLNLLNREGNLVGKARELSYRAEPARPPSRFLRRMDELETPLNSTMVNPPKPRA
jgi:hypothetical protein